MLYIITQYRKVQTSDKENIDKIDKFLWFYQTFPYQILLPAIANVVLATILSIFNLSIFSQCYISLVKICTTAAVYANYVAMCNI